MTQSQSLNKRCVTLEDVLERHDRELFAFKRLGDLEKVDAQVTAYSRYIDDPWAFLSDCVFTLDQVNRGSPIKPFPSFLEYCRFLTEAWTHEPLIAVPKSRRMICSWTFISLYTWDTIFHRGRFNAFVSKKEDDSGDLVSRAEFIYNHIPEWRIPRAMLPKIKNGKMSKQPPLLEFEDIHSKIQGFPQGSDQMRQFTLSGMLFDEWAFWDQAQSAYSAAKPTLDGGGRLTGISSRSPGFFKKVVFDQFDAPDLTFREVPPVTPDRPLEGVECWKNPSNNFFVIDLHYTADPRKRSTEWRDAVKRSLPKRDYEMEYERSWQTFEGRPVYEDWNKSIHISRAMQLEPGIPILLGWDFGLTPACILTQLVGRRLRIYKEFIEDAGSISKLAPVVWNYLMQNYLTWMHNDLILSYVDPAGFQKAQTDERTCADIMRIAGDIKHPERRIGFKQIRPGPVTWEARRRAVEAFLTQTYGDGPGLEVDENCSLLIEGFGGGYRYPEKALEIEPTKVTPIKNKYSHPHDALQYVAAGATQLAHSAGIKLPLPSYGFQAGPTKQDNFTRMTTDGNE